MPYVFSNPSISEMFSYQKDLSNYTSTQFVFPNSQAQKNSTFLLQKFHLIGNFGTSHEAEESHLQKEPMICMMGMDISDRILFEEKVFFFFFFFFFPRLQL